MCRICKHSVWIASHGSTIIQEPWSTATSHIRSLCTELARPAFLYASPTGDFHPGQLPIFEGDKFGQHFVWNSLGIRLISRIRYWILRSPQPGKPESGKRFSMQTLEDKYIPSRTFVDAGKLMDWRSRKQQGPAAFVLGHFDWVVGDGGGKRNFATSGPKQTWQADWKPFKLVGLFKMVNSIRAFCDGEVCLDLKTRRVRKVDYEFRSRSEMLLQRLRL